MTALKVAFMGCPDFAVPALEALATDQSFEIPAVYCMPDRPKGRGKQTSPTPVKEFALKKGFRVETPATFRQNPEAIETLRSFNPDFLVVVAYGLILPESVLQIPRLAPVNLHASILPEYRGPSPIHHVLLQGRKETGNTVMLMSKGMDEGDILAIEKTAISDSDDLESLHDRLSAMGAPLLIRTLKEFAAGKIAPVPQNHAQATYTCKITPQMARIDWHRDAEELVNLIRAMSPFPGAWFEDGKERIKIFKATAEKGQNLPPGSVIDQSSDHGISIACGNSSALRVLEVQKAGKARMKASDFLKGCRISSPILLCENINNA